MNLIHFNWKFIGHAQYSSFFCFLHSLRGGTHKKSPTQPIYFTHYNVRDTIYGVIASNWTANAFSNLTLIAALTLTIPIVH